MTVFDEEVRVTAADTHHDVHETDRALNRLVGLVVVLASCVLIAAAATLILTRPHVDWTSAIALAVLVSLCSLTIVRVRIRSTIIGITWTDSAAIVAVALLPTPCALLIVAGGVIVAKSVQRMAPLKLAFAAAKETLTTAVAALVVLPFLSSHEPLTQLGGLALTFGAATVTDELLVIPVLALATRTSIRDRLRSDVDHRIVSALARFAVMVLALVVLTAKPELLIAIPLIVLSLHLTQRGRLRARSERLAWQHLAEATDALNAIEMDTVLRTAVHNAARLFSADWVEVEVWRDTQSVLIRGTVSEISHFGAPDAQSVDPAKTAIVPLVGDAEWVRVGELRLCFRAPVSLSEREHFTLRAFGSALCTAVRNASSYDQLAELAGQNAHDATHDPLTGLPNRRRLQDEGAAALERRDGRRGVTALVLLDLNHFKDVNDALGHSAGDQVLIAVATRLSEAAGPGALVTRLGGDEFAVLYPALPAPALAMHRAAALLVALREPVDVDGMPLTVSASAGVSTAPSRGGFVELLRRADIAMYQAKRTGQPVTAYARDNDTADRSRLVVGGMLPRAVAEKEFTLEFQPIVDLASGQLLSAEALARWQHPERGTVSPGSFLEPIERSGLLTAFTDAVLDQALGAASQWRKLGCLTPVAVNISPRSLLDSRLPMLVKIRLEDHKLTGDALVLELTESLTISQLEVVDKVLAELLELGCMLALDDFGTGFSSLSVLPRIPVQEIKIDRSFVMQMENTPSAAAVVRSTIDMARALDLLVVAEGVERESQRRMLWELGCTAGQGHLFAKSMPLAEMLKLIGAPGPTAFAEALHDPKSVVRMPNQRRTGRTPSQGRLTDSAG